MRKSYGSSKDSDLFSLSLAENEVQKRCQSREGFPNPSTVDILGQIILCWEGCSVPCKMLSSIIGLYSLDSYSTHTSSDDQKSLQILSVFSERKKKNTLS